MNTTNSRLSASLQRKQNEGNSSAQGSKDVPAAERAAIEIQREEHQLKADTKDVLKAVFMWRDDPQERANS